MRTIELNETQIARFWTHVRRGSPDECWPWRSGVYKNDGYGKFCSKARGVRSTYRAHRVAYTLCKGPIPEGMHVLHSCIGNRTCCNPSHLRPGTNLDNIRDRMDQGRTWRGGVHGEAHGRAKLSQAQVDEIRSDLATPATVFAARWNVNVETIRRIRRGEAWQKQQIEAHQVTCY